MRIALTNAFLPSEQPSGVPFQVHYLANALVTRGHDVTVFSFSPRPTDALYAFHQFQRPRLPSKFFPFFMAACLARTDFSSYDVVHAHGDNFLLRTTCPVLRTFYGSAIDELKNAKKVARRLFFLVTIPLEWFGERMSDYIVGISEATRARIPSVQEVIPCGVDLSAFQPGEKTTAPTVLFVGTEGGRKRGAWLAQLFKTEVLPSIPTAELRMVSEEASEEKGVRRYGRVSAEHLAELYRSSWAFCLPSTYEGFGVPYIEAMAARTAVIATSSNPGAREVLGAGSYGAFVDDDQLAATLKTILTDATVRDEFVRRGTERSREYTWEAVSARYESAYLKAIASKDTKRHR
jgi:phosphatidylinositol alpha-mannosyltransferase